MRARKSPAGRAGSHRREERALRIGVREHAGGADLLALGQSRRRRRGRPSTSTVSTSASAADVGPGLARGVGHRRGEHAHAAAHEPPLAHAAAGRPRGVVVQQDVRPCPGVDGPGDAVVDRVPPERRLHVRRTRTARPGTGVDRGREQVRRASQHPRRCAARGAPTRPASRQIAQRAQARGRAASSRRSADHACGEPRRGRPRTRARPRASRGEKRRGLLHVRADVVVEQVASRRRGRG